MDSKDCLDIVGLIDGLVLISSRQAFWWLFTQYSSGSSLAQSGHYDVTTRCSCDVSVMTDNHQTQYILPETCPMYILFTLSIHNFWLLTPHRPLNELNTDHPPIATVHQCFWYPCPHCPLTLPLPSSVQNVYFFWCHIRETFDVTMSISMWCVFIYLVWSMIKDHFYNHHAYLLTMWISTTQACSVHTVDPLENGPQA